MHGAWAGLRESGFEVPGVLLGGPNVVEGLRAGGAVHSEP